MIARQNIVWPSTLAFVLYLEIGLWTAITVLLLTVAFDFLRRHPADWFLVFCAIIALGCANALIMKLI